VPQISGSDERPRLAVFRSNTHIYAQVIDDTIGNTLAAASTLSPEIREKLNGNGSNVEAAKLVGAKIAELCKEKNIEKVGRWACFNSIAVERNAQVLCMEHQQLAY
jgi:large subunit ribosomal protein L18